MASAGYPVYGPNNPQRARARLYADGTAVLQAATPDFGTGVATMTQVAADALGLPVERCRFEGGDTTLPTIAAAVGSSGSGMISAAVHTAAKNLRDQLIGQAVADAQSPLHGADPGAVTVQDGRMMLRDRPGTGETYGELLNRDSCRRDRPGRCGRCHRQRRSQRHGTSYPQTSHHHRGSPLTRAETIPAGLRGPRGAGWPPCAGTVHPRPWASHLGRAVYAVAGSTWSLILSVLRHSEQTMASWVAQAVRSGRS